ncbi:MAG: poly(R)-hydroxyalkanoic acid synthase subunit PhaE [Candidatus Competibacteraceae bacterium]
MADLSTASPADFDAELLLRQARAYLAFGEQIRQFADRFQDSLQHETDWRAVVRRQFDQFKEAITQSAEAPAVKPELAQFWTTMLDAWQQAALALELPMPGGMPTDRDSIAWQAYQQTQNQYFGLLQQAAEQALNLMEQRLRERAAADENITSLRELYDLWVECNEETYGRMLHSAEYSELSGRLLNALLVCYPRREAAYDSL